MSKRLIVNQVPVVLICNEPDGICELCLEKDELRPYGPNGERICFKCGMKDRDTTDKMMGRVLFGDQDD